MANKRSPLWNYFEIEKDDAKYVVCLICKLKLPRGGEGKKARTSMKNHLQSKHPDKFSEIYGGPFSTSCGRSRTFPSTSSFASTSAPAQPASHKQLTLAETVERKQYWGIDDPKSKEFHYSIGEMIALDNEPLSMVDRVGFNRLMHKAVPRYKIPSRTFMTEKIVPDIYDRINKKMMENISKAEIEQRFQHLDDDPKYFLATLLDPRFKTTFFGIIQTEKARQKLLLEDLKMSYSEEDSNSSEGD
nr:unnamed protein product [Callosobruchus chinensis]